MKAAMIDVKSMSDRPDAFIAQLGICVMDLDTGEMTSLPVAVNLRDEDQVDRHIDPAAVRWWVWQERGKAQAVFSYHAELALSKDQLWDLLVLTTADCDDVWLDHGAAIVVLGHLFDGKLPWAGRSAQSLRTEIEARDPNGDLRPFACAVDVELQMRYLKAMYDKHRAEVP